MDRRCCARAAVVAGLAACLLGGAGQRALADTQGNDRKEPEVRLDDMLRLHVEVLELSTKAIGALDRAADLGEAAQAAIGDGEAKVRYVLDTPMVVGTPVKLSTSAREPFIRGRSATPDGQIGHQVDYDEIGCNVEVRSRWADDAARELVASDWNIRLSDLRAESGVQVAEGGGDAPLFVDQRQAFSTLMHAKGSTALRMTLNRRNTDETVTFVVLVSTKPAEIGQASEAKPRR